MYNSVFRTINILVIYILVIDLVNVKVTINGDEVGFLCSQVGLGRDRLNDNSAHVAVVAFTNRPIAN